jgi:hypothetical protein
MTETNDAESRPAPPRRSADMRYINVLASLLAVFVSLVSLWLAYSSNRTQERMLAASSWPYLRFGHGNLDRETGDPAIGFSIGNGGSGPAVLHWVQLSRNGVAYDDAYVMLRDCCGLGEQQMLPTQTTGATDVPLPPASEREFFRLSHRDEHAAIFDALNKARWDMRFDACYCSIIGECWLIEADTSPEPIEACPAPPEGAWEG